MPDVHGGAGDCPAAVRTDGAKNFTSAHERELWINGKGKASMHTGYIHPDGDMNTNQKSTTARRKIL